MTCSETTPIYRTAGGDTVTAQCKRPAGHTGKHLAEAHITEGTYPHTWAKFWTDHA